MPLDTGVRPLLRGWSHALATGPALFGAAALIIAAQHSSGLQASIAVYGVSLVLLFAVSGTYHVLPWSRRWKARWRRIDHAMIFVMIAGTYTPISTTVLSGWLRIAILGTIWLLALAGVALCLSPVDLPPRALAATYLGIGWVAIAVLPSLAIQLGVQGLLLLLAGGLLYSVGAVMYAARRPVLWPRVFGYHELFHLLVIAASAVFFSLIAGDVVSRHPG